MRKLSLLTGTLLFLIYTHGYGATEPVPGSTVNDKIRFVQLQSQGANPLIVHALIAARDADGLSAQLQNGKKFYLDWTISIVNGNSVIRTLTQREQIIPPFHWVQLPRAVAADSSCGGPAPPNSNSNAEGTEPFVQVESTVSWDGKDQNGDPVAITGLTYRADAAYTRITPTSGQTAILGIAVPHCDQLSIPDSEGPDIKITGVEEGHFVKSDAQITVEVTDPSGVADQDIKLDNTTFASGSLVTVEGPHTLDVTARDTYGNFSSKTLHFTIDKTAPEIVISGIEADHFYTQPVAPNIEVRDANPDTLTALVDSQAYTSGSPVSVEGRHELLVTAQDKAGNTARKLVVFGVDMTPPQIFIQTPKSGSLQTAPSIQVSGSLVERFLKEVTVNGNRALASSDFFQFSGLQLIEGLNTIVVVATDLAGNTAVQSTTVVFDQTPPGIAITSPQNSALFSQGLIAVTGTLQGNDIVSVKVNGAAAVITGSNFGLGNLRLSEGVNTIRAVVTDTAGNSTDASVQVTLDTISPRLAVTGPPDGSVTSAGSTNVSGFVSDTTAVSLTVNGSTVSVAQDGSFQSAVSLSEGKNSISIVARDALANENAVHINVTRDSTNPEVVSIIPANGSLGVPVNQQIEVLFSEEVKGANANTIQLKTGNNLIPVNLQSIENRIMVIPQTPPLSGAGSYTLSVSGGITDVVGNPLKAPASSTFSTVDTLPPAPPVLSPEPPSVTSEETITVTGAAEAKSKVEINGGAARVDVLATDAGQFTAQVPLFTDAVNQLSLTATDVAGNTSTATTATIVQDSQRMVVVDAIYQQDGSLLVSFSKAPDLASVTPQNLYILTSSTIGGSAAPTANPNQIRFYPASQLGASPFVLKVETTLKDSSGKNLEYPWSKLFNAAAGESFVQGEVYDNATGLPLAGASVQQIVPAKNPAPIATTDSKGQFVLPTSSGNIILRIIRAGYQYVDRSVSAPAGSAVFMFDARLQSEDSAALILTSSSGVLQNSDGSVVIEVTSGTVMQNAALRLNSRDGQSLPALLPDGWSPVAVVSIDTAALLQHDVKLRVRNSAQLPPFATVATAYYDGAVWKYGEPAFVTSDGVFIEIDTNKAFTHAFLLPDPQNPPPAQQQDALLIPSSVATLQPAGNPLLNSTPTGIYPDEKAQVDISFTGNAFRSGTKFQAVLSEDFNLLEGLGSVQTTPRIADLVAYTMGKPSNGQFRFYASPSKAIDFGKLDVGFINVEIHDFPASLIQPGVIGNTGGSIDSSTGDMHLTIPSGALDHAVPVTLTAFTPDQIHLALPDYTLVSAFEINFAGSSLLLPATIDAPANLQGTPQLIIARLAQIGFRSVWVLEGTATYDGARVRSTTGSGTLRGITMGGVFGVFAANRPIGFITGTITNPQNTSAGPGIVIISDQTQLIALSNSLSAYTLAVPVLSGIAKASNQISGDEGTANYTVSSFNEVVSLNLRIQITPPRIVSITPANGATGVDPNTSVRVTFSEAILPSTLTASSFYLADIAGSVVPAQVLLTNNNTVGVLALQTALGPDLDFTVVVTSAITDLAGNALANPTNSNKFHTLDSVPPRAAADARFKLFLPENGVVKFQVPQEDIEAGISLVLFNETQGTSISAVLQNGNFIGSIAGTITDKFFVLIKDAANNQTRVDFKLMEFPDGSGAVFPTTGGKYTTSQGIEIEIADGTFDTATPVQLRTLAATPDMVPAPRDFQLLNHFTLNLNGQTAQKPIELSFPVPAGLNVTSEIQIFVVQPISFFGKRKYMPIEIVKLEDGMLRTQSPPWPGVRAGSILPADAMSLIMSEGGSFYYLQGHVASLPAVIEWDNTDLAILLRDVYDFIVPLPVNVNYTMTVSDLNTGITLFEGQPAPPASERQTVVLQNAVSTDTIAPYVIGGSPMGLTSWRIGAASGDVREKIHFQTTDENNDGVADIEGIITITGDAGALPFRTPVAIHNDVSGDTFASVAAADGSFSLNLQYRFGDPITLLLSSIDVEPGSLFRFNFSEPVQKEDFTQKIEFFESENPTSKITFTTSLLQTSQILEIAPAINLKSDTDYTIKLQHINDLVPNEMKKDFAVRFRTRAYNIVGDASSGKVNDTLLLRDHLIVAKEEGVEIYSTANPFDMGHTPVAQLPIIGGVRSLARYGNYVLGVGGGVNSSGVLHEFDFTDIERPRDIASLILTRFVGDSSDDQLGQTNPIPEGRPLKVMAIEGANYAYVATLGVGIQVIDLAHLGFPIYNAVHRKYTEANLKDFTMFAKNTSLNLLLSGISMHSDSNNSAVSLKSVDAAKVIAAVCNSEPCQISTVASNVIPGPANNVEVLANYEVDIDQDGRTGAAEDRDENIDPETGKIIDPKEVLKSIRSQRDPGHTDPHTYEVHDLAFVTGTTSAGKGAIHVVEITEVKDPRFLGSIPLPDGVFPYDLKLDKANLRLYVPAGSAGIYIVDIKDPFLIHPNIPPQVIGHISLSDTITDGNVTIDDELNTVYIATADQGVKSVLVGKLNVEIVTDKDNNGVYEHVGVIESEGLIKDHATGEPWPAGSKISDMEKQDPVRYYLLAQLPSGAGGQSQQVDVKVSASNFFDAPIKLGSGFPQTEFQTVLKYKAPIDRNKDSFRLFVSEPFYITAHPILPAPDKIAAGSSTMAAGDFIRVDLADSLRDSLSFVTTDLLRQSRFSARALRLDWIDSENPEPRQNPTIGNGETDYPPYTHSGEWTLSAYDFKIKSRGFDFVFTRKYESQALHDGPLGFNWDHAYFARLIELPAGHVIFYDGMGHKDIFNLNAEKGTYLSPPGVFLKLDKLLDGNFRISDGGGTNLLFNNYGQLAHIEDRNENSIEFFYNPAGQLVLGIDTMGRPIAYQYNNDGKVIKVKDFDNREWTFAYDEQSEPGISKPAHFLNSVTTPHPGGNEEPRVTRYEYSNPSNDRESLARVNLTSITDPRHQKFLVNSYNSADQLSTQQYGNAGQNVTFAYDEDHHVTRITDRNENMSSYAFGALSGSSLYNVLLSLNEPSEGAAIETRYEGYDQDGLAKTVTLPGGDEIVFEYTTSSEDARNKGYITSRKITGKTEAGEASPEIHDEYTFEPSYHQPLSYSDYKKNQTTIEYGGAGAAKNPTKMLGPEDVSEQFSYNDFGQVVRHIDGSFHDTINNYYPEKTPQAARETNASTGGYLKSTMDNLGRTIQFSYDERGNVIESIDPNGVRTRYLYNKLDQLIEVIKAAGTHLEAHIQNRYDPNGNLIEILTEREPGTFSRTTFEYGILNNVTKRTDYFGAEGFETASEYDNNYNLARVTHPEGDTITYDYNKRNQKTKEIRGKGTSSQSEISYEYDRNGNVLKLTDGRGLATSYEYDGRDHPVRITYPDGNQDRQIFDENGLLTDESTYQIDSGTGTQTELLHKTYRYDGQNRVTGDINYVLTADPGAAYSQVITGYSYNTNNLLIGITDARQHQTTIEYDDADRQMRMIDADGNKTEYEYDGNNNVIKTKVTLVAGQGSHLSDTSYEATNTYDALNRVVQSTDPLGHTSRSGYDLAGNLKVQADALNNIVSYEYDDLNRLTRKIVQTGGGNDVTLERSYDKNSRLKRILDARANATTYEYDEIGRTARVGYPAGGFERYEYDAADNVIRRVDRNGTSTEMTYDNRNRLVRRIITGAPGVSGVSVEDFNYDAVGRMIRASDEDSVVQMQYDSRGLLWRDQQKQGSVIKNFDELGNNTKIIYPFGNSEITHTFDNINRLISISNGSLSYLTSSYRGPSEESDRGWGNGLHTSMEYDGEGRLTQLLHGNAGAIAGFGYSWNAAHQKTQETLSHWGNVSNTYNYDGGHRLINASIFNLPIQPDNRSYSYDNADNLALTQDGQTTRIFSYGLENRNQADGISDFIYDNNGNLRSYRQGDTERQFAYDYANRLVEAKVVRNGSVEHLMAVEYDPLGRRTSKTVDGLRTEFVYDGNQVIQEVSPAGAVKREYIWGDGIDELVAIRQNGQTYYTQEDSIGSVVAITDASGAVVERYSYDAYGKPFIIKEIPPPCVSTVSKASNVLTVDYCESVSTLLVDPSSVHLTPSVPFTLSTSADVLTITLTAPVPPGQYELHVFGVKGDGTVIPEIIERGFDAAFDGTLPAGGASPPVPTIVSSSSIGNVYLFQGREWDSEVGLYYYRARYYDPSLGRFLSQDPEQYSDSPNLYQAFLNNPANYTDPMGTSAIGDYQIEQEIKTKSPEYIKQWQQKTKSGVGRDAICGALKARFKDRKGYAPSPGDLIYGNDPQELYVWFLNNDNEGQNCSFSHEIGLPETGHEFAVAMAAVAGVQAFAAGATVRTAVTAAADELAGQVIGITPSSVTALVRGTKAVLRLSRSAFTAEEIAAIEYKYAVANKNIASGLHPAETGAQVPYRYHRSQKFVRDTYYPEKAIKSVRVPEGYNVDEIVPRQFGGPQVPSNQQLLLERVNKILGPLEYQATKHLPKGTTIQGYIIEWVD